MIKHYVYIIYSVGFSKYYKGYSTNLQKRLAEHNDKKSRYTKHYVPWVIVFLQSFDDKEAALKREKSLKKYSKAQIEELIKSELNELNEK
jgi:putative endonuclease